MKRLPIIICGLLLLPAAQANASEETPAAAVEPAAIDSSETTTESTPEIKPISMDRSNWPVIVIGPESGRVTHHPAFMGDVPMNEDIVSPLHAPDPVWQLQEAMRGDEAGNWNGENMTDLGTQPFIALARFAALPFRMILENPWSQDTSPK